MPVETPKTPREEWDGMIKGSSLFKRSPENRKLIMEIADNIIEIALNSSDAMDFHDRVKRIDPSIGWTFKPEDMPKKYSLAMELINERARNKMEEDESQPDIETDGNKIIRLLRKGLKRIF